MTTISEKNEKALTIFTHDQALITGLSKLQLRMFYTNTKGLYVATNPNGMIDVDKDYTECAIATKKNGNIDYVTADNENFTLSVDVEKMGKEYTYSKIEYYNKGQKKQRTINNPAVANKTSAVKTLTKTIKSIFKR